MTIGFVQEFFSVRNSGFARGVTKFDCNKVASSDVVAVYFYVT